MSNDLDDMLEAGRGFLNTLRAVPTMEDPDAR